MVEFKPKCINGEKVMGHSATGWIVPCCWLDPNENPVMDDYVKSLFTEDLKLSNVDTVEDILYSESWLNFMEILIEGSFHKLPHTCRKKCCV